MSEIGGLSEHKLSELKDESTEGLKIFVETAWGWVEVKVSPFLKAVEKRSGSSAVVVGYCDIGKVGAMILKVPRRT